MTSNKNELYLGEGYSQDTDFSEHLHWRVTVELPKSLLPDELKDREPYKHGWMFRAARPAVSYSAAGLTVGFSIKEYINAFRMIAKQFNEWADILEKRFLK